MPAPVYWGQGWFRYLRQRLNILNIILLGNNRLPSLPLRLFSLFSIILKLIISCFSNSFFLSKGLLLGRLPKLKLLCYCLYVLIFLYYPLFFLLLSLFNNLFFLFLNILSFYIMFFLNCSLLNLLSLSRAIE